MMTAVVLIIVTAFSGLIFGIWVVWLILPAHTDKWHPYNPFNK